MRNGVVPLLQATRNGRADIFTAFLKAKTYVDEKKKDGLTPLLQAEQKCHADSCTVSTVNNANVNYKDVKDFSTVPLQAAYKGHYYLETTACWLEKRN